MRVMNVRTVPRAGHAPRFQSRGPSPGASAGPDWLVDSWRNVVVAGEDTKIIKDLHSPHRA